MRDWRVLVGRLVAGDGAYVTALVIDVDLAGGRIGQQIPFVRRRRIGIGRHVDDWRRGRSRGRRRRRGACGERDRCEQRQRQSRNLQGLSSVPIHHAARIGALELQIFCRRAAIIASGAACESTDYLPGMPRTSRKCAMVFSRPGRSAVCGCHPRTFFARSMFGLRRTGSSGRGGLTTTFEELPQSSIAS
jgi:hypothetical protein